MMTLTKEQRKALKRVFDRQPLVLRWNGRTHTADRWENYPPLNPQMTYREFRKLVVWSFDCVMVPWCGMWLGIEKDGYTHS
jgi:putative SOS response-associated peptidase YedK